MTQRSPWPWLVLVVWCAWIHAVGGRAAAEPSLGGWVPDLGLVLLLALEPRLVARDAFRVAAIVALTRLAFSADAPPAVLAGVFAAVALSRAVRSFVEVDGAIVRTALAGASAAFAGALAAVAHLVRVDGAAGTAALSVDVPSVLRAASATALAAAFLGPLLGRLPGLSPFGRERRVFA